MASSCGDFPKLGSLDHGKLPHHAADWHNLIDFVHRHGLAIDKEFATHAHRHREFKAARGVASATCIRLIEVNWPRSADERCSVDCGSGCKHLFMHVIMSYASNI